MRSFIVRLVTLAFLVSSMGGCYLGHSRGGKAVAYGVNGTLVAVGAGGIANGSGEEGQLIAMISVVPVVVGLVGIAIDLATATEPFADPPAATAKSRGSDFGSASR